MLDEDRDMKIKMETKNAPLRLAGHFLDNEILHHGECAAVTQLIMWPAYLSSIEALMVP